MVRDGELEQREDAPFGMRFVGVGSAVAPLGTLLVRTVSMICPGLGGSRRQTRHDGRCNEGDGQLFQVTPVLDSEVRQLE